MLHIDNKYQFLFIHIPKCAGTSIEKFFEYDYDIIKDNFENNFEYNKFNNLGSGKHFTLKEYEQILSKKILDNLFKFTIIRNPFDLVVSQYNYDLNSSGVYWNGKNSYDDKKNISFEQYVNFLYNKKINIEHYITSNNYGMDFIGKFENIENDFKLICDILNIKDNKLPFENKSKIKIKDYKNFYNDKTKNLIYDLFSVELKKYNYDF